MASLIADRGRGATRVVLRRILVITPAGKREAIRLGAIPLAVAQTTLGHVERLASCAMHNSTPPADTCRWLEGIGNALRARLVLLGLATPAEPRQGVLTLRRLRDRYQKDPSWLMIKEKSRSNKSRAFELALDYFGDVPVGGFTPTQAKAFYSSLRLPSAQGGNEFSEATANMIAGNLHALFAYAIEDEQLGRNPFRKVPRGAVKGNNADLTALDNQAVLNAIVGTEGRLLFGLSRWAGLRIPSEIRGLRWCDVDREHERFRVFSPKTEKHPGRRERWVPIFPELAPLFQARYDDAQEGEQHVLPRLRLSDSSAARSLVRGALRRCRIDPWPRLFHSMRATRQTELAGRFPAYVVNAWIGNTAEVAEKHYLMVTEEHYQCAANCDGAIPVGAFA